MSESTSRRASMTRATVLFVDVLGFTPLAAAAGTEQAYLTMTRCMRELDGIARHNGGSVDKYLGDRLMAVFGHPIPMDGAEAGAARAALEMRAALRAFVTAESLPAPLGIRIGGNAGDVISGDIRGPVVREFHVLGDVVNTAARLGAKASDGEIYLGETMVEALGSDFEVDPLPPFALKGKARPVPAASLQGLRRAAPTTGIGVRGDATGPLVGRDELVQELTRALGAWQQGGPAHELWLHGPDGAGKSRLLAELGQALDGTTVTVLQAAGDSLVADRPLAAFAPLLEGWLRDTVGPGVDRAAALRRVLPDDAPADDVASLEALLGVEAASGVPDGPERVDATAAALRRVLGTPGGDRHVLVVVEDVERLDPASQRLLAELRGWTEANRVFTILTTDAASPQETEGEGEGRAVWHRELAPLTDDDARALVRHLLPEEEDGDLIEALAARADGWPGRLALSAFLAPAIRSEREQARAQVRERTRDTERRRAVVLFADISGFTAMTERMGAERAYPIVAEALGQLDAAARAHGGTVDHYLGDCVMALFGVPEALEDAPRAALNAAIEMRDRIDRFARESDGEVTLSVHTGVAAGLGIAGDVSGPMIREFAVMGDHVHLADALCHEASSGEIFLDAEVARLTREVFDFETAGQVAIEGRQDEFGANRLLTRAVRRHRARLGVERRVFSRLVGRDAELGALRARLAALSEGQGGVISLIAEAGIGKSRLLAELEASPEAKNLSWQRGRSLSNGLNVAYHPVADLVRSWVGIDDEDDAGESRGKLERGIELLLPDSSADVVPLMANLMGLPLHAAEQERLAQIQGDARERLMRGAMTQVLRAASGAQPLVIVLEDLHWADHSSVELVETLLRLGAEAPILFLHAFRPGFESTSERLREHARELYGDEVLEIALQPLSRDHAREMVKNLFGGGDVPQATRAAIEERALGNPFYIEEVVRNLVDAGAVERRGEAFFATEKLDSVAIPDTVQEAVLARVDRLDPSLRSILQVGSVIGSTFHREVVAALAPDAIQLDEGIEQLIDGEFLMAVDRSAGIEFGFQHPLIQEVTYDAILESRRKELHGQVGLAIEGQLDDAIAGYHAMLAFHYSMGGDVERAEDFLFRAGDEAARMAASSEALQFFQAASALYLELHGEAGDPDKRARLERNIGSALLNRGQLLDAVDHFDRATELMGAPAPRSAARMWGRFVWNLVRVVVPLYLERRGRSQRPAATEQEKDLFQLMFTRAIAQSTSAPTRFLVDSMAMLARGRGLAPETIPESAAMYSGVVAIFAFGGLSFELSRRFLQIAEDLAEKGAVEERVLYFRTLRFLHHLLEGDWSHEYAVPLEEIDAGLRDGRFWEASTYLNLDGVKRVYQGDFPAARERIEALAKVADVYQHELASSAQHAVSAYLHVERREFEAALADLERYYDEHREPLFNLLALGTRAKVHLLMGDREAAEASLERADQVMAEAGRVPPYHASSVRVARYLGDLCALVDAVREGAPTSALRRALRRSSGAAQAVAGKVAFRRPEVMRLRGLEAWWTGRRGKALARLVAALEECEMLGAHPEVGRIWLAAAEMLEAAPELGRFENLDAAGCRLAAREVFEALDLRADLRRLDEGRGLEPGGRGRG